MKQTIYIYPHPWFDSRFKCGISRLYQIFSKQYGFNLEIIDDEFLKNNVPQENSPDILVIAGGDGTLHRVINTIPADILVKYNFGIMPGGTANEFAKSIEVPIFLDEAASVIAGKKNYKHVKAGVINGKKLFMTGFLYGLGCHILRETREETKLQFGEYAYPLPGLLALYNYIEFVKEFTTDAKKISTGYLLINNANLKSKNIFFEKSKKINEESFSLIYLSANVSFRDLTRLAIKNRAGNNIIDDQAVFFSQDESFKLNFDGEIEYTLDGEFYKGNSPLEFTHSDYEITFII